MLNYTLITGASSGIGFEMAKVCADKGMNVLLVALPNEGLEEKAESIASKNNIKADYFECDLTDVKEIDRLKDWVENKGYALNFLVNNAGFGGTVKFSEMSAELVDKMMNLNIKATTHMMNRFVPLLKENQPSNILNVSSLISNQTAPYKALYTATETYVRNLSVSLSYELIEEGVSVSVLLPGATPTNEVVTHQIEKGNFAAKASVMSAHKVAKISIEKALKGDIIITTGAKNGLIRRLLSYMPNKVIAKIAINQYKKQNK